MLHELIPYLNPIEILKLVYLSKEIYKVVETNRFIKDKKKFSQHYMKLAKFERFNLTEPEHHEKFVYLMHVGVYQKQYKYIIGKLNLAPKFKKTGGFRNAAQEEKLINVWNYPRGYEVE